MSTLQRYSAFLAASILSVCMFTIHAAPGGKGGGGKGGDGGNRDIPLVVSFDAFGAIRGDGNNGIYIDGDGSVEALIRSDGHFDLNTHNGGKRGGRKLHVDLSATVTDTVVNSCGADGGLPDFNCNALPDDQKAEDVDARMFTLDDTSLTPPDGIVNLLALQPGDWVKGGLAINFSDGCGAKDQTGWAIRYRNTEDTNFVPCHDSSASIIIVAEDRDPTKSVSPDNATDTWVIWPEEDSSQASLLSVGSGLREIVYLPFVMTATIK